MPYAIELSPRQSARTIEQAVRHASLVALEPRIWPEDEPIECQLAGSPPTDPQQRVQGATLTLLVPTGEGEFSVQSGPQTWGLGRGPGASVERLEELVGTYCDATIHLGEHRYLFCSDVTWVERGAPGERGVRLVLSRPATLQVVQRRRFRRLKVAKSAQIEMRWLSDDKVPGGGVGWLCNICAEGLACRIEQRVAEQLWIGEKLRVSFALEPGGAERFDLDAVLCNKIPAGTEGKIILGLQFLADAEHESSAAVARLLRRRLIREYALAAGNREGADA